jgi:hypothetical protein
MIWNITTIGVVIGFFFLGYIIGLVEAAIKQRNKDRKKKEVETQEERKQREISEPSLLSIQQSPSEMLILEMEGQKFNSPEFLTSEKRNSLINLLIKLRPWVENEKPGNPVSNKQATPIKSNNRIPEPAAKTRQQKVDKGKSEEEAKTGMVAEIDEILQKKLSMSHLENKGVHLLETPAGGVLVFIGMDKYEGISAVPDSDIKTLIQSAVKEWELKN